MKISDDEQAEYKALFFPAAGVSEEGVRDEEGETRQAKALTAALDARQFEIELYWKRATYFWALIAAAFAAYAAIRARWEHEVGVESVLLALLVASVGFVLSVAWLLVNQGSKFWQENWETHVELLEDGVIGPLHRVVFGQTRHRWSPLLSSFPQFSNASEPGR